MIGKPTVWVFVVLLTSFSFMVVPNETTQAGDTTETVPGDGGQRLAEASPRHSAESVGENQSSTTEFVNGVNRGIFRPVNESTILRLEPHLQDRVLPLGYQGHSYLEIDVGALHLALRRSLEASLTDRSARHIAVPVTEDLAIRMEVSSWANGNFGVEKFRGSTVASGDNAAFPVSFRFDAEGKTVGVVKTANRSYLIESIGERPYYVVFASEHSAAGM